jgi:hypothetical protein
MATRTKPQAPRTLNCAILKLYGPDRFAISALRCEAPTHLLSAGSDSKSIDLPRPLKTPAPSFKSPYRNRLESSSNLPLAYCSRRFRSRLATIQPSGLPQLTKMAPKAFRERYVKCRCRCRCFKACVLSEAVSTDPGARQAVRFCARGIGS